MKLKSVLMSAALLGGLMAGQASANPTGCSLSVSQSYVPVGQMFTYGVGIHELYPGPQPPPSYPYSVVFYGTRNGVNDIPPEGETYPAMFDRGNNTLTGYGNPGGYGGDYLRYALIYKFDQLFCVTNLVSVTLE
ncbi:MAG: hypothetical protein WAZ48_09445 [Lysobacteraceae bacterium]